MKSLLLFALLLTSTALLALTPQERAIVQDMTTLIKDQHEKLEASQLANDRALSKLTDASGQLIALQADLSSAQQRIDLLVQEREALRDKLNRVEEKLADLNSRYQFAQFLIAITTAVIVGLGVLFFAQHLVFPYSAAIPIAIGAATYVLVTFII